MEQASRLPPRCGHQTPNTHRLSAGRGAQTAGGVRSGAGMGGAGLAGPVHLTCRLPDVPDALGDCMGPWHHPRALASQGGEAGWLWGASSQTGTLV